PALKLASGRRGCTHRPTIVRRYRPPRLLHLLPSVLATDERVDNLPGGWPQRCIVEQGDRCPRHVLGHGEVRVLEHDAPLIFRKARRRPPQDCYYFLGRGGGSVE